MNIAEIYQIFLQYPRICTDSRNPVEDSVFFALKGENFDANSFARDALDKGCKYAVIDNPCFAKDNRFIVVGDTLSCLQQLANHHRNHYDIPVIGITGSNGKTTTKELISSVLSSKSNIAFTEGNLNNHIGVPLTLLKIKENTEIAVIEMGANHPGEIMTLCKIAQPSHGIITNIGKAHIEGFGSFDNIIKTKAELYNYLSENQGIIFQNSDNEILTQIPVSTKIISYGTDSTNACSGKLTSNHPYLEIEWNTPDTAYQISTQMIGGYNFENILAAVCIGRHFQIAPENINAAISNYKPGNLRSQLIQTDANLLILDAYNANPVSMNAAIDNLIAFTPRKKRKVAILGDMLELGNETQNEHKNILKKLRHPDIARVILVGKSFTAANTIPEFLCFDQTQSLISWLKNNKLTNCTILIKGSRGIKLEQIVEYL